MQSTSISQHDSLFGRMSRSEGMIAAAWVLGVHLAKGRQLDAKVLRSTMEHTFQGSDAEGLWDWRDAYEAAELAQVLYLRRHAASLIATDIPAEVSLASLKAISVLAPSQTRRSERQVRFQQFSTPLDLAYCASIAADPRPGDVMLEPSAGTGLLAIFAEIAGARVHLNELENARAALLEQMFRETPVTRLNAEQLNDRLPADVRPNLIIMNPPFSVSPGVTGRIQRADFRHIESALARLAIGGRLVAITGSGLSPEDQPELYDHLRNANGQVIFTRALDGRAYARHGTTTDTRLTVIDKVPGAQATAASLPMAQDSAEMLASLEDLAPRAGSAPRPAAVRAAPRIALPSLRPHTGSVPQAAAAAFTDVQPLHYNLRDAAGAAAEAQGIYEAYTVATIDIEGAKPHPSTLVESAAMSAVRLPRPTYQPHLPKSLVVDGVLSDAQLETVIYAGQAHSQHLPGHWRTDETFDVLTAADAATGGHAYRQGFFLGDGTGAGKGRQAAATALDNWLQGRRKVLWISKNEPLLEDARRDWSALGGRSEQVVPQSRFPLGSTIPLSEGILFTTYSTLRSGARGAKASRLDQVLAWLGDDFDGLIIFDEAHAMANAAGEKGARGARGPSEQGRIGLRLQNARPDARILYVSATGATVVSNLGYSSRLGLWGGANFPFPTRSSFVAAMEAGGVAAMEVLARDLKALGLYTARSLSYAGVEYEILEHELTEPQTEIYNAYADAFTVIHNNLEDALRLTNINSDSGTTLNGAAKGAARSAFESAKQRFFSFIVTSMKMPTVLKQIERDLADGLAPVVQLVTTGEALMERRLAEIPVCEWDDIQVDITPREYVLDYLANSFPIALHELYSDEEGNVRSRLATQDGQVVICQAALAKRDEMIEFLGALPPVQAALDQLIQHFGTDQVAEVTGRSRRIVKRSGHGGDRLAVQRRPASSNRDETTAFMDGRKSIIVFSEAGGTGRSYHADRSAKNQRRRVHYLLESGWKADAAVQGLGRTNRTNQVHAPLLRPVATNVKGEKRFLSTIARRLDSLGALTKGQRQTGGQGLFRPEDNLESDYAKVALRRLYRLIYTGEIPGLSLEDFEAATGLALTDSDGSIREDLPPMTTFLNRVLAMRIAQQNAIFGYLEERIEAEVDAAIVAGTYEVGVEQLTADRFDIAGQRVIYRHEASAAETRLVELKETKRSNPLGLDAALAFAAESQARFLVNKASGRAALCVKTASLMDDAGVTIERRRLIRPMAQDRINAAGLEQSNWVEASPSVFAHAWAAELADIPEFIETTFHLVTGLLLPIWSRLPTNRNRVYRLQAHCGERLIGRVIDQVDLPALCSAFGLDAPALDSRQLREIVYDQGAVVRLADDLQIRQARVMHARRLEISGLSASDLPRWKAQGLITEIISYKTRAFIPLNETGLQLIGAIIASHPVVGIMRR